MVKIFLDDGHGGSDPGSGGNGLKEKDLTLKIGNKIRSLLKEYDNVSINNSRTSDKTMSLKQRTDKANEWGADLFLSIHINAGGGTGFESFIHNSLSNDSKTNKIRNVIHDEVMKLINVRDRGKKKANFHVLRESNMNALLTENLFIDTKKDSDLLKKQSFINKLAQGHVNGIVKYYKLKKKNKPSTNKPSNKKETFNRVIVGSYKDRKNADRVVTEMKKLGYNAFIDIFKK